MYIILLSGPLASIRSLNEIPVHPLENSTCPLLAEILMRVGSRALAGRPGHTFRGISQHIGWCSMRVSNPTLIRSSCPIPCLNFCEEISGPTLGLVIALQQDFKSLLGNVINLSD